MSRIARRSLYHRCRRRRRDRWSARSRARRALALHYRAGEVWPKALTYLRLAGAQSIRRSAYREAVASFEQALDALARVGETAETRAQGVDIRFELRNALLPLGERARILSVLRDAEALASTLGDRLRLGWVFVYLTHYFRFASAYDRGVEVGERALAIAAECEDFDLQVVARFHLGQVYSQLGEYPRAMDNLRRNVEVLQGEHALRRFGMPFLPAAESRSFLVFCLAELGAFTDGIALADEALRIAEQADHPFSTVIAYRAAGLVSLLRGDFARGVAALERSLELCQARNIRYLVPFLAAVLGYGRALSGNAAEAVALLEHAREQGEAMEARYRGGGAPLYCWLGEAHLLAGRLDEAARRASEALELYRGHKERGNEAWALRLMGEIASQTDPLVVETADGHYREAMTLAADLGMRPLVAHCHLGLGRLYRRAGHREREHLVTATTMYRDMDMEFWRERTEAEINELT